MAYIGLSPVVGEFRKLDDISGQFNDSNTVFNLTVAGSAVSAGSAQNLIISVDGIVQEPQASFTVGGSTLTFTEAPSTASTFFGILLGSVNQVGVPSDGSVTTAVLQNNAVTSAKIQNNAITTDKIANGSITASKLGANVVSLDTITGLLTVDKGGTGATTLTANSVVIGNGTSSVNFVSPGPENDVLLSIGSSWISKSLFGTVVTPNVFVQGGPTNVLNSPFITTSNFFVLGNLFVSSHVSTDYQVVRTSNSEIVFNRVADTGNLQSLLMPDNILEANTQYDFKVKHNSLNGGNSLFGSNVSTTQASFVAPTILGQAFGGGFYSGTINIGGGVCYYLIVAPNSTGCNACQWKTTQTDTAGTNSSVNGFTNTYNNLNNAAHPAGNFTATRTISGFSDFFLPAKDELLQLYTNQNTMPAGEGFGNTGIYWSSTQTGATTGYNVNFYSGFCVGANSTKTTALRVRAIRRIPI